MKSCVITSMHPVYDKRIFREIKSLLNGGVRVDYIVPVGAREELNNKYKRLKYFPLKKRGKIQRILNHPRILMEALKSKANVYHFHDPDLLLIGVILTLLGKSVIYDVHEHFPNKPLYSKKIPSRLKLITSKVLTIFENFCSRIIKNLIVVEDNQFKRFSKIQNINIETIFNYSNLEVMKSPIMKRNNVLIHTGTMSETRGSLLIIELAILFKKYNLNYKIYLIDLFVNKAHEKLIKDKIDSNDLHSYIKFHAKMNPEDIQSFIKKGSYGISFLADNPSFRKAIPTKIFEYMTCGLPILISDLPYSHKFVVNNKCGEVFNFEDPDDCLKVLMKLSDDYDEYASKSLLSSQKYNWGQEEIKLINYYNQIVNKI